eukprot:6365749-Amphidinium_carterae.2
MENIINFMNGLEKSKRASTSTMSTSKTSWTTTQSRLQSSCSGTSSYTADDTKSLIVWFPVAPEEGYDNCEEYVDMQMNIRKMKDDIVSFG